MKSPTDSDWCRPFPFEVGHREVVIARPLGGRASLLVVIMTGGGADASRESVDATRTRDPAGQARVRRDRASDCALDWHRAKHSRANLGADCRGGTQLAAAGDTDRPGAGGQCFMPALVVHKAQVASPSRIG